MFCYGRGQTTMALHVHKTILTCPEPFFIIEAFNITKEYK